MWLFKIIITTVLELGYSQYNLSLVDMVWVVLFCFVFFVKQCFSIALAVLELAL